MHARESEPMNYPLHYCSSLIILNHLPMKIFSKARRRQLDNRLNSSISEHLVSDEHYSHSISKTVFFFPSKLVAAPRKASLRHLKRAVNVTYLAAHILHTKHLLVHNQCFLINKMKVPGNHNE